MGQFKEDSISAMHEEERELYEIQLKKIMTELDFIHNDLDELIHREKYYGEAVTREKLEEISRSLRSVKKNLR